MQPKMMLKEGVLLMDDREQFGYENNNIESNGSEYREEPISVNDNSESAVFDERTVENENAEESTNGSVNETIIREESRKGDGDFANRVSDDQSDSLKASSFYTESYKKPGKKRNVGVLQLVAVALVSSIIGGSVVGGFFQFVVPSTQPAVKNYFQSLIPGKNTAATAAKKDDNGSVKKVEIQSAESSVTAIAEKVGPSVVGIRSTFKSSDFFFGEQSGAGEGSGIIIKSDGYIMTNNHVIADAVNQSTKKLAQGAKIEVFLPSQKDKPYEAQIIGYDIRTDLAVIKINATNLPAAELGNSDDVKVGELAVAIGNPGGLEYMGSVTVGVISGINRTVQTEGGKELKLVQTDAAINPGNSGGALVNSKGQVIGVNSVKIVSQGFEGLGFAIPINKAKEITDSLMQFTYVKGRAILGVTPDESFTEDMAKRYNVPAGVLVKDVAPFSGAYKGGIKAGDIITKFEGKAVKNRTELDDLRSKHKVGDTVTIEIYRYNDEKTLTLKVQLSEDKG